MSASATGSATAAVVTSGAGSQVCGVGAATSLPPTSRPKWPGVSASLAIQPSSCDGHSGLRASLAKS